ncbi:cardiolipin synthase [Bacteroidia bacterium]|nr:cardiolipin synthase [Bacteroidia bacterium]
MIAAITITAVVGTIAFILYSITILGLIVVIITENRNPLKTISWVIVLLLLPGLGLIIYFFFGQDGRKMRFISRHTYKRLKKQPLHQNPSQDYCEVPEQYNPLVTLLGHSNQSPLLYGSKINIYTNGHDKFDALFEELEKATHHIHFQYYIFLDDAIGNKVKSILMAKAQAGVMVRVLYDYVGCWNVKKKFFQEMQDAGVEVYPFLKVVFPVFTSKVNYRNHRKIVVIDGKVGFMGGMNVADRYNEGTSWGNWRDTHFKFEGKGVQGLQFAFLLDWFVISKQLLNDKVYYPPAKVYSDNIMQLLTSGPVGQWRTLLQAIIFVIANAKKYIYIQTPYFLPTEGLNQALQAASLGGVDVRLMLPKRSDTKSANIASHSFIDDMVKAGTKIYFYDLGFLHSKCVVSDDAITCIGSANMDFRSFEHNFEITAFVYQPEFALQMKRVFLHDQQGCEKLNTSRWMKRPLKQRIAESFMRLFSPLL